MLVPLFVFPARWFGRRLAALTRRGMEVDADLGQVMNERFNVSGAHLVKVFGDPATESERFAEPARERRDLGVRTALLGTWFRVGLSTIASLAVAGVYGLGGLQAIAGELTVGTVVALATYLTRLYGPLTAMANVQVDVMTALVSFERVLEVLDLEPSVAEKPDATDLRAAVAVRGASISFADVTFRYPAGRGRVARLPGVGGRPAQGPDVGHPAPTSRSRSPPARWWRSSARPGRARRRSRSSSAACTTRRRARCASPGRTCGT